jgi:Tol biopolymer transport system component
MAELREVFEMVTKQTEPDLDSWKEQQDRQRRRGRNRRIGAFVVAAAIVAVALGAVITQRDGGGATQPAASASAVPSDAGGLQVIDIATGQVSAGPALGTDVSDFVVSPDGTKVAYVASSTGWDVVHVADLDGSNVRAYPQTQALDRLYLPSWSPDGSTIVYQDKEGQSVGNLFLLDVASGAVRQLTDLEQVPTDFWEMSSAFVSGGDTVVFTWPTGTGKGLRHGLWSVPVTGGEPTHILRGNAGWVDASPVGSRIVFSDVGLPRETSPIYVGDLWIADADGSNAERLVDGHISLSRWSPDGTRISYDDEKLDRLMILDLASGEATPVQWPAQGQDWVDDGTLLVQP